jgi:hypothetical protein
VDEMDAVKFKPSITPVKPAACTLPFNTACSANFRVDDPALTERIVMEF